MAQALVTLGVALLGLPDWPQHQPRWGLYFLAALVYRGRMSEVLLQVLTLIGFGAFCFGWGYLAAFIVTRNQWRDEMIKRRVARYNWQAGKWEWGEPPKDSRY
jgi:hypothetical protein